MVPSQSKRYAWNAPAGRGSFMREWVSLLIFEFGFAKTPKIDLKSRGVSQGAGYGFVVSHPWATKNAQGWGTERFG
jgi:hypothetical protein